nr:DUF1442 domain-containing protein [uncultured Cohaesibacter sp.]
MNSVLAVYHERLAKEKQQPRDRASRSGLDQRLLAIGPETGQLVNILASSLEAPTILEIGTSYGYSGIWLADAARKSGGHLITMELQDYKSAYAREMSERAGLSDFVNFQVGDAIELIQNLPGKVDFILLDLWNDLYLACLEAFYDKLNPGAIIVADNMMRRHDHQIHPYSQAVRRKMGISSVLLPVGSGIEVSRFEGAE